MPGKNQPKAIQVGGLLGLILPYDVIHLDSDHEALRRHDVKLSVESDRILSERDCIVATVREQVESLLKQAGALCSGCRTRIERIENLLAQSTEGAATERTLEALRLECEALRDNADCEPALRAAGMVLASMRFFRVEFESHTINKHCPAKACPRLIPAPCQLACPAGIDIPSYLALVAHGRYEEALEVIREDNPFAWVCGLICPHPCEKACVRGHLDEPVNIRYPKAFVAEWAESHTGYPHPEPAPSNGRKVAIVGSGPAGLSAAHYLALKGYQVTILESLPVAGGLLMVGIPEYRLPRRIVHKEIDAVKSMGVQIHTGVTVGKDVTLDELRAQGFEAFFLAIGAHRAFNLEVEGEDDFPQVYDAITFLREISLGSRRKPAEKVVVVGGGNSAMDAARTCLRLGCGEVHVAYRRTREEMPASPSEVEEAMEEGAQFHFLAVPVRIEGHQGQVTALECLQARLGEPDAGGRRRPIPVEGSNFRIEAGAVISAIGQQPDFRHFSDEPPFPITPRNLIITQPPHTRTTIKDIFAGGDAVTGPATVVQAVAAGKQAALDIDGYLSGALEPAPHFLVHKRRKISFLTVSASEKITNERLHMPLVDAEVRAGTFEAVELSCSEDLVQKEARRCLRCDVCIRCGTCERICREDVKVNALEFSPISREGSHPEERVLSNYERPKEACITCGACAIACPTNAMELVETQDGREVHLCGTVLNRLEALKCTQCGAPFVPSRYLEYVTSRCDAAMGKHVLRRLCPQCAREKRAQSFVKL